MKPIVSIVVPVYNAKDYLRECIDSIITQRGFEQTELIFVDDGSSDVSSAICSMYSERFENVFYYRQENSGVSAARNRGIDLSKGDYVFFADADDFLFGGIIERIIDTITKNNPDFIFWNYKYEYPDSYNTISFPFEKECILSSNYIRKNIAEVMLSDSSFNSVWNKAFKKEIISCGKIRFTNGRKYGEDKDFVLSFLQKCGSAFYIDKTGYFYRYVETGAIQKARNDYFSDIVKDYENTLVQYDCLDVEKEKVVEKNNSFTAIKVISSVEMAFKKCSKKAFSEIIKNAHNDKSFYTLLKDLYDGGWFGEGENKSIAYWLLKENWRAIYNCLLKCKIKNKVYSKLIKAPEKEQIVPEHDNEKILEYPYKITVFTPVYNRSNTIHRVFESLMKQTYKSFEWLIIDDGSTDNLKELVDEYRLKADFLIRYYYKSNGGKHTAINWAYQLTDSEYFITVDSDDALCTDAIEKFLKIWDKVPAEKRKDYWSVVARCNDARTGKLKGELFPDGINEAEDPEAEAAKISGDKISCPRTEILKQFPFPEPEGTTFITESVVWNRINRSYKQYYTNEILLDVYANEEDSLTFSWFKNHIKQGYISNYFWMCSQLNEGYEGERFKTALKLGYYGYVSGKSLREITNSIDSLKYRLICVLEYPFLFVIKKLRYDKYTEN